MQGLLGSFALSWSFCRGRWRPCNKELARSRLLLCLPRVCHGRPGVLRHPAASRNAATSPSSPLRPSSESGDGEVMWVGVPEEA